MKMLEMLQELPNCDSDEVNKQCWKKVSKDLLSKCCYKFVKNAVSAKCNTETQ